VFIGVALLGCFAVSLLVEAATGHGSSAGNILMMGLGLMLLVLSAIVLIFGIKYWRLSQPRPEDANK
jgi:protein-S-isoprenylcysteine O-methyltransferase Ste14